MLNSYSLANKLKECRKSNKLTITEQCLYHELVSVCNANNWSDEFYYSNIEAYSTLGIHETTLHKARKTLIKVGLIFYRKGSSFREPGCYSFIRPFEDEKEDNPPAESEVEALGDTLGDTLLYKTETKNIKNISFQKLIFEEFRNIYPGNKRGLETEFQWLRKKHKDYKDILVLLYPAVERWIQVRKRQIAQGKFVPPLPHLKTWINQRRWEDEMEGEDDVEYI